MGAVSTLGLLAGLVVPAELPGTPAGLPAASAQAAPASVTITGHGDGHGRGMGQYGALGYALDGWSYSQILAHYYGGTTLRTLASPEPPVRVVLMANDGNDLIVTSQSAFSAAGHAVPAGGAALLHETSSGLWSLSVGPSCAGPWPETPVATGIGEAAAVAIPAGTGPTAPLSQLLGLCEPDGVHHYRGDLQAAEYQGAPRTVDVVSLESYLQGVVPAEMPSSWATLGAAGAGGQPQGLQAVEAQAVASRSYAVAARGTYGYADICDSQSCQVYEDVDTSDASYDAPADQAIAGSAGQVLYLGAAVASTQYSASSGGWTAGGTFPPVPDAGDSVCVTGAACNPWHTWTRTVSAASVEAAWPSIGQLDSLQVTARDGNGDWGGRVLGLSVQGSAGSVALTGASFAGALGLPSAWFTVAGAPGPAITGYYVATTSGAVFDYGSAGAKAGIDAATLNRPLVGMAATPDGGGVWLDASDGGIFAFGDARFHGSMGGHPLNQPMVGMAPTADGGGYWTVASDGGIFAFGDARFYGSLPSIGVHAQAAGMLASPDG
ncbi:MAG: SpoIID/LytB domain-containing protein, partial [Acidimicrobiales bacterium]